MLSSILKGITGFLLLLGFYFLVVSLVSGWDFARSQFLKDWYWILGLAIGFGIQIALWTHLRALHRAHISGKAVAISGTTSGAAMIACCAHYLVNILPIIGITGFITIISQYQTWLFVAGLVSNIFGMTYLVNQFRVLKHV